MSAAVQAHLDDLRTVADETRSLANDIAALANLLTQRLRAGGKAIWLGNGGSAAEAQHLAAELVGRFARERAGLASISLAADTSALTAIANDYGYEQVFSRQVQSLCDARDVVIGLSTSGTSPNVVAALKEARRQGAATAALTGASGGDLSEVDHCIRVPSSSTSRIQEMHLVIGHVICDLVEQDFAA